jgi:hypothetical protein
VDFTEDTGGGEKVEEPPPNNTTSLPGGASAAIAAAVAAAAAITPPRVVYYLKKPHMSLKSFNAIPPKPQPTNHFEKYSDVKGKEERRPTISDLSSQKSIYARTSGWRLHHVEAQINDVVSCRRTQFPNTSLKQILL